MKREISMSSQNKKAVGRNYLVTIAIDKYTGFDSLNNASRDADDITETLTQLYQFEQPEDWASLRNEEATEENIYHLLEELVDRVTKNDNVIIFFSGHGHYNEKIQTGYWIPVNARQGKAADYISNADILNNLAHIKAHHLLLFADSCFSGTLIPKKKGNAARADNFPSRRIFASGSEVVDDGIPGENSPFVEGILNFLRYNKESAVDTSSLIHRVKRFVKDNSTQSPIDGRIKGDDNGEFIFHKKISEEGLWRKAAEGNKIETYRKYLEVFPEGDHRKAANTEIAKLREKQIWEKAKRDNTPDDINHYLTTYSHGDFVEEAKKLLEDREAEIEQTQIYLKERSKKRIEREKIIIDFVRHIDLADLAYSKKDYEKAHKYYWQSLDYHLDSEEFVPTREVIEDQIDKCNKILLFEEYKRDGKRAFKSKSWDLAQLYLNLALGLGLKDDEEELNKLLRAADTHSKAIVVKKGDRSLKKIIVKVKKISPDLKRETQKRVAIRVKRLDKD